MYRRNEIDDDLLNQMKTEGCKRQYYLFRSDLLSMK